MSSQKSPTDLAVASGDTLEPGYIRFYEAIQPPLVSGSYQLTANQTIQLKTEQPVYSDIKPFAVQGPRFRLQPGDVQQVYPPANQVGSFNEVLPHVVFRDRTLPWSRTIDGSVPAPGAIPPPWLAVLTLYPSDLMNGNSPIAIQQGTVGSFLTAATGVIVPAINSASLTAEELAEPLMYIELPQAVFLGVAPTLKDLPYLAHARQVNTDGKEILGLDADGYFSVLVGNRLPMANTGPGNVQNTMIVVSLEGLQASLPVDGSNSQSTAGTVVRMAVLSSWIFQSAPATADFLSVMKGLKVNLLTLPFTPPADGATPAETTAAQALGWGYVPLANNTRSGEGTTSWYRGPCVPLGASLDPNGPYEYSDNAIRFDSGASTGPAGTGLFDMSYAAAWQIGRLIALSDATFSKALMDWRQSLAQTHNQNQGLADLMQRVPGGATQTHLLDAPSPDTSHLGQARVAVHAALTSLSDTGARKLPKKLPHEERGRDALPGVLSAVELSSLLSLPGDPVRNLLLKTLGTLPGQGSAPQGGAL